jgi:hypothetical protein
MNNVKFETRTPLKAPPLRQAGQSIEEQIQTIFDDQVSIWAILVVGLPIATALLTLYTLLGATLQSLTIGTALLTCIACPVAIIKIVRLKRQLKNLRLGRDGERVVGQFLDEQLRARGYHLFHDVVVRPQSGGAFNIDHIAIGAGGIFVLETKTRNKPALGDPVVEYDGEAVKVGYGPRDPSDVQQVAANARWLADMLEKTTGQRILAIRPVLLYPGWWIEGSSSGKDVWVLEPKALPKWLDNERPRLTDEQIALYSHRVSQHVREA